MIDEELAADFARLRAALQEVHDQHRRDLEALIQAKAHGIVLDAALRWARRCLDPGPMPTGEALREGLVMIDRALRDDESTIPFHGEP